MSKLKWQTPTVVPVEGQITITGRVQLIASCDLPKNGIKKGQAIGRTISKTKFYEMTTLKTVKL